MDQNQIIEKLKLDLKLRGYSKGTEKGYCERIKLFQEYYQKPASELGEQEIRQYLYHMSNERKLSPSTVNTANSALRFLFEVTLEQNLNYKRIPCLKDPIVLPTVFTKDEIGTIFNIIDDLKHKCILMTIYGSGLRILEAASLKISDIDSNET